MSLRTCRGRIDDSTGVSGAGMGSPSAHARTPLMQCAWIEGAIVAAMSSAPAVPRPSSTVILLREESGAERPFSVLMLERHGSIAFPGATAFPGGMVDAGDEHAPGASLPATQRWAPAGEGDRPPEALAYWVAAVRELFEEVGILLAARDGRLLAGPLAPELAALRARVAAGEPFAGVLASAGLGPATDAPFPFRSEERRVGT